MYARLTKAELNDDIAVAPSLDANAEAQLKIVSENGGAHHITGRQEIAQISEIVAAAPEMGATDTVVAIGMGLGCGILKLLENVDPPPHILIFEYSPQVLCAALHCMDLEAILAHPNIELFLGDDINIGEIFQRRIFDIANGKVRIVPVVHYPRIFGEPFLDFGNRIVEWLQTTKKIWQTMKRGGRTILANTIANMPSLITGLTLGDVRGIAAGVPAVCIAAGPSLDDAYDQLRKIGDNALLFACDSAVQGLLENGIKPHIVVTTDMNVVNYEKIRPVIDQLRNTVLIYGAGANPDNVRGFPSRRRIAVSAENAFMDHWVVPQLGVDCRIPALTSVTHAALFSAMAMKADPIALVGVDLAFIGEKSHAHGSVFEYRAGNGFDAEIKGLDGSMLQSTQQMIADKAQIESVLARVPAHVINTSENGAAIKGTHALSLGMFRERYLKLSSGVVDCLEKTNRQTIPAANKRAAAICQLSQEIELFITESRQQNKKLAPILAAERKPAFSRKLQARIRDAVAAYRHYEKQYAGWISLLTTLRLDDIQTASRREASLKTDKSQAGVLARAMIEMRLLDENYHSLATAAEFIAEELGKVSTYINWLGRHGGTDAQPLDCARFHAQARDLYLAEKGYREYIDANRADEIAWCELVSLYMSFNLWGLAEHCVNEALEACPDSKAIQSTASKLDVRIGHLRTSAKKMVDNHQSRLAMATLKELLAIDPWDHAARMLYEQLQS